MNEENIKYSEVVAYQEKGLVYPENAPFDPDCFFSEYPFGKAHLQTGSGVYGAVREVLHLAGLDETHYGSEQWNPLGDLVKKGQTVLIKPNWVFHKNGLNDELFSIITHPSVLRPLVDYAYLAVGKEGKIWIADAPQFNADYQILRQKLQLDMLEREMKSRGVPLTIADLRSLIVEMDSGVVVARQYVDTDASEGVEFDLGADSEFAELADSLKNLFGSDYDRRITCRYHRTSEARQKHCYRISKRVLEADLVISVPKLKTHKKTGVTLNIKNMIGINTDKNYIPHYRVGSPGQGGDEFPDSNQLVKRIKRWLIRHAIDFFLGKSGTTGERIIHRYMQVLLRLKTKKTEEKAGKRLDPIDVFYRSVQGDRFRTGNWWGNDTTWRAALDINKILFHGTPRGTLETRMTRHFFSLIDGITGGDEDGPMAATPRPEGVLVAGFDPVRVDSVAVQVMGFDPKRIRDIQKAKQLKKYPIMQTGGEVVVRSNQPQWQPGIQKGSDLKFRPHFAWEDYLESDT